MIRTDIRLISFSAGLILFGSQATALAASTNGSIIRFDGLLSEPEMGVDIPAGFGQIENVSISYATVAEMGDTTALGPMWRWEEGYGDLMNVAIAFEDGNRSGEIKFEPDDGYAVRINSFDLGLWDSRVDTNPQFAKLLDEDGSELWSSGAIDVPATGHLSFVPSMLHAGTVRLQFGTTWNTGIDNVSYDVVAIPEPSTGLLCGATLLLLLAALRRHTAV